MLNKYHEIIAVAAGSIAAEMGIAPGDKLFKIDGIFPEDIFDYQYLLANEYLELLIGKPDGEEWLLEIEKEEQEDLGLLFAESLMDEYRSCQNKCLFCFIDQLPPGLRETLYFKDDDARLSFLQGNYVTLTNMTDADVARIIRYRLAPLNISIHTTDKKLRCRMLNNRFAGAALKKIDRLFEAGIAMNGQIVLCKGINDEDELKKTLRDLTAYLPHLASVSVVPAGLTKYRENLYPLEAFTKADALRVLAAVHESQERIFAEYGVHFAHASDEWYLLAGAALPAAERYDGYLQLENGVGMMRLFLAEFFAALPELVKEYGGAAKAAEISVATGLLAYGYIKNLAACLTARFPALKINVFGIVNNFFGAGVTVSGLLTGADLAAQLKGKRLGRGLLLPANVLRAGEEVFLDGLTVTELEKALQAPVNIVKSSGREFAEAILKNTVPVD